MEKKEQKYWDKKKELRRSMPEILRDNFITEIFGKDEKYPDETLIQKINRKLYQYKEIKMICKKTHIPGFVYCIILLVCLLTILVGYFQNYLTILIATLYPLYTSFKTLQFRIGEEKSDGTTYDELDERKDIIQWLNYWIIFSIFINIESIFGSLMKKIPLYFFAKIVFLLLCFLPQYQLSGWLYNKIVRKIFWKCEGKVMDIAHTFVEKLKARSNEKKNKNKFNNKTKGDEFFKKEY